MNQNSSEFRMNDLDDFLNSDIFDSNLLREILQYTSNETKENVNVCESMRLYPYYENIFPIGSTNFQKYINTCQTFNTSNETCEPRKLIESTNISTLSIYQSESNENELSFIDELSCLLDEKKITLDIFSLKITKIKVVDLHVLRHFPRLTSLNLGYNEKILCCEGLSLSKIKSLEIYYSRFDENSLKYFPNLTSLSYQAKNSFIGYSLEHLSSLTSLDISSFNFDTSNLKYTPNLKSLSITSSRRLNGKIFSELIHLKSLSIKTFYDFNNGILSNFDFPPSLVSLELEGVYLSGEHLKNLKCLQKLKISFCIFDENILKYCSSLTSLKIENNRTEFKSINLRFVPSLVSLELNKMVSVDLSYLNKLESLSTLRLDSIGKFDESNVESSFLEVLQVRRCHFTGVCFQKLPKLHSFLYSHINEGWKTLIPKSVYAINLGFSSEK